jgi:hypothetical protein
VQRYHPAPRFDLGERHPASLGGALCLLHISHTPPEGLLEKIQSVLAMSVCETVVTIHLGLVDVYPSTCLRQMTGLVICAVSAHPSSWSSSAVSGTSSGRSRPFR